LFPNQSLQERQTNFLNFIWNMEKTWFRFSKATKTIRAHI
jgi:hypothetical protein